jgi:hypothetical protein
MSNPTFDGRIDDRIRRLCREAAVEIIPEIRKTYEDPRAQSVRWFAVLHASGRIDVGQESQPFQQPYVAIEVNERTTVPEQLALRLMEAWAAHDDEMSDYRAEDE